MLLVAAGLLIRSLVRVLDVNMGFDATRASGPDPRRPRQPLRLTQQEVTYIDEVLRLVRAVPGVEAAGITDALPLGRNRTWGARARA